MNAAARAAALPRPGGPGYALLLGNVARRHYLQGQSKVDIAAALGISRFKVARLLEDALSSGLVRIEIGCHGDVDVDLSVRLQEAYGLSEALVVQTQGDSVPEIRRQLGAVAAQHLEESLTGQDVLGLPWSRTVDAMVDSLTQLPPIPVVQLSGALPVVGSDSSVVDVVVRAARRTGARGYAFYAPLIVDDEETAEGLRRQPQIARSLEGVAKVTTAVVGVGAWAPNESSVFDACTPASRDQATRDGAVGEIAGVFFDHDGCTVKTSLAKRIIALSGDQLRAIPQVMGMAWGAGRANAVRAAIRGTLLTGLVCDSALARALVAD